MSFLPPHLRDSFSSEESALKYLPLGFYTFAYCMHMCVNQMTQDLFSDNSFLFYHVYSVATVLGTAHPVHIWQTVFCRVHAISITSLRAFSPFLSISLLTAVLWVSASS